MIIRLTKVIDWIQRYLLTNHYYHLAALIMIVVLNAFIEILFCLLTGIYFVNLMIIKLTKYMIRIRTI